VNDSTEPYVGKHFRHWQLGWAVYQVIEGRLITLARFETRSEARAALPPDIRRPHPLHHREAS
jgi:hypothetical protein